MLSQSKSLALLLLAVASSSTSAATPATAAPAPSKAAQTEPAPTSYAACAEPPAGMACIPGGPATVGADEPKDARPKRTVEISTFYLDKKEVTHAEYQRCVDDGSCPPLDAALKKANPQLMGADQPALPIGWKEADAYCTWAGKRLPTEWEWEKAARGAKEDAWSWGNDDASCTRAQTKECADKGSKATTKPVGSFPAGAFGLFDMNGNAPEWTATWATDNGCVNCTGVDPKGPCDGAFYCQTIDWKKVVRGGSFSLGKDEARSSSRRAAGLPAASGRVGFRCAATSPVLSRFPARVAVEKRPPPPEPKAPTAEQLKVFTDFPVDALSKQECPEKGRSFIDCRDPNSYIKSNEPRQHLWKPYIENLGGGYTGVGIDQNYTFIALARSEWAWLFDYDPTIVRLHHVLRAMILDSKTRQEFVDHFKPEAKEQGLKLISEAYAKDPERAAFRELYAFTRASLYKYYVNQLDGTKEDPTFGWLASDQAYQYVRTMYQQGRIHIVPGDMLANKSMQGIGKAAKALGVVIRVYYPSNAPECWPHSKQYKDNVQALPFDDQTVVLQTLSGIKAGFGKQKGYWHYNVQSGLQQQQLMRHKGYMSLKQLVWERNKTDDTDLTLCGLAAASASSTSAPKAPAPPPPPK